MEFSISKLAMHHERRVMVFTHLHSMFDFFAASTPSYCPIIFPSSSHHILSPATQSVGRRPLMMLQCLLVKQHAIPIISRISPEYATVSWIPINSDDVSPFYSMIFHLYPIDIADSHDIPSISFYIPIEPPFIR